MFNNQQLYDTAKANLRNSNAPAEWYEALEKAKNGNEQEIMRFEAFYLKQAEQIMASAKSLDELDMAQTFIDISESWGALRATIK